jgi:hypothetical protein
MTEVLLVAVGHSPEAATSGSRPHLSPGFQEPLAAMSLEEVDSAPADVGEQMQPFDVNTRG